MRRIRAEGHVYGDGNRSAVGRRQQAGGGKARIGDGFEAPPQRFADSQRIAVALGNRLVHLPPGLLGCPEAAVGEHGLDVLAGRADMAISKS